MVDFVSPLVTILGGLINFLFQKVTRIQNLDQSMDHLEAALEELTEVRDDLKKQVDRAELVGLTCTNQVKGWLTRVDKVEDEVSSIKEDMEHNKCCCNANCSSRYKLGKRVAEKISIVNDLKGKGKLEVNLADGLLLVPVVEIPCRPVVGLELMLGKVRHRLKEENVGTIGIYGMGGVGKTTLLKCINNEFLSCQDHDFDVVIWVVVSKDFTIDKIQQAIGTRLGLSWDETQFQELRASRIFSVMRKKRFLLLLDDIWKGLDLDEIGIPSPGKENGSKLIFTTRSIEVCSNMDADFKFKVDFLNEMESWKLFRDKVGGNGILDVPIILEHAKTIVKKCGGYPLAIVTMGRAMANKRTEEEWRYAIEILHTTPSELRGMEDVFALLKFSYENLENDVLRSCVLYCSLFPGDYDIEKEMLIQYWAGEGFLDSSQNGNLHIMGHAIIGSLKVACFLEAGEQETQVKMHDVVRSFALWTVSNSGNKFIMQANEGLKEAPCGENWEQAHRISLLDNEITELSVKATCPNLSTLLLQWNFGLIHISSGFFENMPSLKVLDLSFTSIKELPKSISRLFKLHHLDLSGTKLRTLPKELGSLTNLRHLILQRNQYLRKIPHEAISGLQKLRALNFYYSFSGWEMQHVEGSSEVTFSDLECLRDLESLGITVTDLSALERVSHSQILRNCIQYFYILECNGLYNLPLSSHNGDGDQLRRLSVNNCRDLKSLVIDETAGDNWLPKLEILALKGLPNLTSIWKSSFSHGCLRNLLSVNIWYCDKLKNVSWILSLPMLEMIYIFYCNEMEEVIREEDVTEEDYSNAFPRLRIMSIRKAPELKSICRKSVYFPCLKNIAVIDCPKLTKLPIKARDVSELPTVYCYKEWWDNLSWDDSNTKDTFLPYFMSS